MPELPEVQTIVSYLRMGTAEHPSLVATRIKSSQILWDRSLVTPRPEEFVERVIGQKIEDIQRRGKFIVFHLTKDVLLIHLRMSGDLMVEPADIPIQTHHRLVLVLDNGYRLSFNDPRKFGRVWLTSEPESILGNLGPEPLDEEFSSQMLQDRLKGKQRQIKPLLLDQSFLAGIGNIYADEALHKAGIHPLARSNEVTPDQVEMLWASIRHVLQEGIKRNGASIDWVYRGGEFQNYFHVYQRTGEPCYRCNSPIQRLVVGQRSTHFCPTCQPAPSKATN